MLQVVAWLYPSHALNGLAIAAGALAVISEIMMVCSLLFYDNRSKPHGTSPFVLRPLVESTRGQLLWSTFVGLMVVLGYVVTTGHAIIYIYTELMAHLVAHLVCLYVCVCPCLCCGTLSR